ESVFFTCLTLVASLTRVMCAFGTIAPVESVTVPCSEAVNVWACMTAPATRTKTQRRLRNMLTPFLVELDRSITCLRGSSNQKSHRDFLFIQTIGSEIGSDAPD